MPMYSITPTSNLSADDFCQLVGVDCVDVVDVELEVEVCRVVVHRVALHCCRPWDMTTLKHQGKERTWSKNGLQNKGWINRFIGSVTSIWFLMSVSWLVSRTAGRSSHKFLKGRKATLPCSIGAIVYKPIQFLAIVGC